MRIIKKYSNRRLYDTGESQYVTLDELADIIREGDDVQIVDAKSGEDLTQGTLAQIVVESGAARLLPTQLLMQMIRMGEDALAEFMTHYVAWAFEVYIGMRRGMQRVPGLSSLNPFDERNPWQRLMAPWLGGKGDQPGAPPPPRPAEEPPAEPAEDRGDDVETLRREIDELKDILRAMRDDS